MSNKSKGQLKKEDRAFLYFQENSKGLLSIKFGPDKYARDTAKFRDMLMLGLGYGLSFFSGLIKDKSIFEREEFYEKTSLTLSAILQQSFPDVFEFREQKLLDEEQAIKRVEEGWKPSEETLEKIEEIKKVNEERLKKNRNITMSADEKADEILIQLEYAYQEYNKALDYMMTVQKKLTNKNKVEYSELDFDPFKIVQNLLINEIQKLTMQLAPYYITTDEKEETDQ